jgi:hypothetical protein
MGSFQGTRAPHRGGAAPRRRGVRKGSARNTRPCAAAVDLRALHRRSPAAAQERPRPLLASIAGAAGQPLGRARAQDMEPGEIGAVLRHPAAGSTVAGCLAAFPALQLEAHLQPITR